VTAPFFLWPFEIRGADCNNLVALDKTGHIPGKKTGYKLFRARGKSFIHSMSDPFALSSDEEHVPGMSLAEETQFNVERKRKREALEIDGLDRKNRREETILNNEETAVRDREKTAKARWIDDRMAQMQRLHDCFMDICRKEEDEELSSEQREIYKIMKASYRRMLVSVCMQ